MSFNVSKCKVMHVGKIEVKVSIMKGQTLEKSSKEKDIGFFLSCDLKSASDCICIEASVNGNKMFGLVKRTVESRDPQVLYLLFIRAWSDRI